MLDECLYLKAHFHTLLVQTQLSISSPSRRISLSLVGSSGTESTGGSQWRLSSAQGPLVRARRTSLLLSPSRNPSRLYSKPCLLLLFPLRFLKRPQWPLGWQSLDMEWRRGRRRLKEQVILHGWANGNICHSSLTHVSNKKTQEASSENMSTFQLRA